MVNMPPRKRFSEAQLQKVIDEKNELQQRCTHLQEENVSLRRTCKKVKREKKAQARLLVAEAQEQGAAQERRMRATPSLLSPARPRVP